jgi:peptidyl-prolyl cis-trans isomerase C
LDLIAADKRILEIKYTFLAYIGKFSYKIFGVQVPMRIALFGIMVLANLNLVACDDNDKLAGQILARVDGEDITVLQFNDELQNKDVSEFQNDAAKKQLLESMIDRQLIVAEAIQDKIDQSHEVMRAIERAKDQIIYQAYIKSITSKIPKPTQADIEEYYKMHPEYFANCKEFTLDQLIIPRRGFSNQLETAIDSAQSLDQVSIWMEKHGVKYFHQQSIRNSMDLTHEAVDQLLKLPRGGLFISADGENRVVNIISSIKDIQISMQEAAPRIENILKNKKIKDELEAKIANLRSMAMIEYAKTFSPIDTSKQ